MCFYCSVEVGTILEEAERAWQVWAVAKCAKASTVARLLWYPANKELCKVLWWHLTIVNETWSFLSPAFSHSLPPTLPCLSILSVEASLRYPYRSENLVGATAAGPRCQIALPKLLSTMCSFLNKGERPHFLSRAGSLESTKGLVCCEKDPFLHSWETKSSNTWKEEIRSWSWADSNGQIATSGIWPKEWLASSSVAQCPGLLAQVNEEHCMLCLEAVLVLQLESSRNFARDGLYN